MTDICYRTLFHSGAQQPGFWLRECVPHHTEPQKQQIVRSGREKTGLLHMKMSSSAWMRLLWLAGLLILAFLFWPLTSTEAQDLAIEVPERKVSCSSDVCLLKSDADGVTFEVRLPAYVVSQKTLADGKRYDSIEVPGWDWVEEAGSPQLPMKSMMLGVPFQADIELQVLEMETRELEGRYRISPVPDSVVEWQLPTSPTETSVLPRYVGKEWVANPAIYSQDAFYPELFARIVDDGFLRHQRVATIALMPFQYHPPSGRVRVAERFIVQVTFSHSQLPPKMTAFSEVEPAGFEGLLERSLLNYQSSRHWRGKTIEIEQAGQLTWDPPGLGYKVFVEQDGIYRLTYADLLAAGVPVDTTDPRTFQIFNKGEEIAIFVQGQEDGDFNVDDLILFYGLNPQSKYAKLNVYWLTYGLQQGRRMSRRNGSLVGGDPTPVSFEASRHFEEGGFYFSSAVGDDDLERWFWNYVFAPPLPSQTYNFDLPALPGGVYVATLEVALYGGIEDDIDPDHHTQVYVNGHLVEDAWWDGISWRISQIEFPQSYLLEGANEIRVQCPNDTGVGYDYVLVDWFNLSYWSAYVADNDQLSFGEDVAGAWEFHVSDFSSPNIQVFDVTEPISVTEVVSVTVESSGLTSTLKFRDVLAEEKRYLALTSARYLSPEDITLDSSSDWQSLDHGADYIIITHSDFYMGAVSLANHRANQGLRTVVADAEDIFDEFSFGLLSPSAIRDFLAYAYENWISPKPAYVLLIGDGLYDFKDYSGSGMENYVPPYLAYVDPWLGETSADNRYVSVSGEDILPDMHIGRLPVNTPDEAAAVITKILAYEQSPPPGSWNETVAFVTDNPDDAGNFYAFSDDLIDNYLPSTYMTDTIYLGLTCPYENPSVKCKQQIIDSINVTGTLLVNYIGHASIINWAQERLFGVSDILALANSGRYPVFLAMNCYDGYYIYPRPDIPCTGESVVRAENKGAVASWSPAGLGVATGHHYLNKGFFQAMFFDGVEELGPATLEGKLWVYNSGANHDLIETFHLFGDPALRLNVPKREIYLPIILKNHATAPDLVVERIVAAGNDVQVVIKNQGDAPVQRAYENEFWVDFYVNPNPAPDRVNQTWDQLGSEGLVWGVTQSALPLEPGEVLTLTNDINDPYYWPSYSSFSSLAAGTPVYAQVDSANANTNYGAVLENHEISGGFYNNVSGPVQSTSTTNATGEEPAEAEPPAPGGHPPASSGHLPPRP